MKKSVVGIGLVLLCSHAALAQHALIGKYSGFYLARTVTADRPMGLTLEIVTVEGDTVKGIATRMASGPRPPCNGDYPVAGTVKGDALDLRSTRMGGPAGDCRMRLRLTAQENKLIGTMNGVNTELSK